MTKNWVAKAVVTAGILQALSLMPSLAFAQDSTAEVAHPGEAPREGAINEIPKPLEGIGIDEHLGDQVDLGLNFKNEKGETVHLRDYFAEKKPVILTLAYYNCPSLCSFHLNGLKDAFKQFPKTLGEEFNVVTVSIEPKEKSDLAAAKKENYIKSYGRPEGAAGWHFLVGDQPQIAALAKQVGFKYRWDEQEKQYAHASAAVILTPDGHISRYFNGIVFDPKQLHLSLVEASNGQIGTFVDQLVLFCFHYDPKANKYTLYAYNVMRAGAGLMVIIVASFLAPFWFRKRTVEGES